MTTVAKVSLSLPADLFEAILRAAQGADQSRSQTVSELLRQGLSARSQIDGLYRQIARLQEALEEAKAKLAAAEAMSGPPPDFRDFLTGAPPGTAKLRRDLEWSDRTRRQAEADAAEARRNEQALRSQKEELTGIVEEQEEEIEALERARDEAIAARERAEQVLAAEQARKVPWH